MTSVSSTATGGDIGLSAPIINYTDTKGREFSTKKNLGKYILLDFMGSWCVPCIKAIPKLKAIFARFKSKSNFDMASIAVEHKDNRPKFALFEKEHEISWHVIYQPVTGKGADTLTSIKFLVQAYPTYILLDTKGKIIFRSTGNEDLSKINQILDSVLNHSNALNNNREGQRPFVYRISSKVNLNYMNFRFAMVSATPGGPLTHFSNRSSCTSCFSPFCFI